MENINEIRNKEAMKWGLIMGIISIVHMLVVYFMGVAVMASWWNMLIGLLISLTLLCYAVISYRNKIGGFITFGQAFTYLLLASLIGGVLYTVMDFILYTIIDPDLPNKMNEAVIDKTAEYLNKSGLSDAEKEEKLQDMVNNNRFEKSFKNVLIGFIGWFVFANIINLIIAAIVKRTPKQENM